MARIFESICEVIMSWFRVKAPQIANAAAIRPIQKRPVAFYKQSMRESFIKIPIPASCSAKPIFIIFFPIYRKFLITPFAFFNITIWANSICNMFLDKRFITFFTFCHWLNGVIGMIKRMVFIVHNGKICFPVIKFNAIYMMNNFVLFKQSANRIFNYISMLIYPPLSICGMPIRDPNLIISSCNSSIDFNPFIMIGTLSYHV